MLFGISKSYGQYKNIKIEGGDQYFGYPPCEPSIDISPKDPNNMVAGAILDKVYVTYDGGLTWDLDKLESTYGVYGDPCIVANSRGDFYYLHLSDPSGQGWMDPSILDRIVCQRSKDKGDNWTEGSFLGLNGSKDQDKQWAAINQQNDEIYATWTQFDKYASKSSQDSTLILFSKSNRKAKRWSKPVRVSKYAGDCLDGDETVEGAVPCVGPNGEIYVSWALGEDIWFDYSLDGGDTWLEDDIRATGIIGGWEQSIPGINRCNGMPVTVCDLSGSPHRGTIYINYTDQRNGENDTDVWLVKSSDGGLTWTEPLRVNDDLPGSHQFFTWMDVDPITGYVYIVFYDRRNYNDLSTEVYLAISEDGGNSFENILISESPFVPDSQAFFGDYLNIAAYNGVVRPIWTRADGSKLSIWTAIIDR